jgi:hypothetical protein
MKAIEVTQERIDAGYAGVDEKIVDKYKEFSRNYGVSHETEGYQLKQHSDGSLELAIDKPRMWGQFRIKESGVTCRINKLDAKYNPNDTLSKVVLDFLHK